ncbi:MAG TPA: flagellar hook-length control protein FliK, partial [Caulobacteraceae bacterium]
APVAPQAALQTPANLAAANGAAIVSQIATQVAKSVDGKSTRFDISLDPAGLGHVNVKVEIGAQGQITAQLSFDNAHTAAEAKSQAGQLQQALEQAGFNIAQGGLSFNFGGQGAGFAGQQASAQQPLATPVQDLSSATQTAAAATASSRPASGVDITI